MAYASSKLRLWFGGPVNLWVYDTADKLATVLGSGYVTDAVTITKGAQGKGLRPGDRVLVRRFTDVADDTTWVETFEAAVSSVNTTTGAGTLKYVAGAGAIGTGTCVSNAVTISALRGIITTEALSTAAAAEQAITLTNDQVAVGDTVVWSVDAGASTGTPGQGDATVTAGQIVFNITNLHAATAFNAALKIRFEIKKA